jgi:hypothetical protein
MNVKEIVPDSLGTLRNYLASSLSLTLATAWIVVAFQSKHYFPQDTPLWKRLAWPFVLLKRRFWPDGTTTYDNEETPAIEVKGEEKVVEVAQISTPDDKKRTDM